VPYLGYLLTYLGIHLASSKCVCVIHIYTCLPYLRTYYPEEKKEREREREEDVVVTPIKAGGRQPPGGRGWPGGDADEGGLP